MFIALSCSSKSGADLIEAVKANDIEKVKKIADTENINSTDETGATPVMWAAYNGNVEVLDFLVKNGADVRKKGIIGINTDHIPRTYTSALLAAAGEGHLEAVKYLVEKAGISPDERGDCLNDWTLVPSDLNTTEGLFDFIKSSNSKLFKYIVENEYFTNFEKLPSSNQKILFSIMIGNIILEKDLENNKLDSYAVRRMAKNRKKVDEVFKDFIKPRKDYNYIKDNNGETALMIAAFRGFFEVGSYLLFKKADPNAVDSYGGTPLIAAAIGEKFNMIDLLLKNNARKDDFVKIVGEKQSVLSLLMAGECKKAKEKEFKDGLRKILPLLWQSEKDIYNSYNNSFPHPLFKTCQCKDSELVRIMMENGADYNRIEHEGR